ncbi:unnamed protein product [Bursaphelenchus okinawaensis]|uniref:Uncharacterized protein n=1 Tax=Bursaphelenchus okinawaensis TaxID=465554 RepID=A0A811L2I4_9BILA|nr:unnamed protein product [Bursaphelenchus okinawaensis]CAG9117455.1 unnamed protein product [Bursaphelenchus okinawaensis]
MPYKNSDVRRFYTEREDIDVEEAERLFLRDDVLRAEDGKKLCVFLALHKMERNHVWEIVGETIVNIAKSQDHLARVGACIALLFDRAPDDVLLQGEDSQVSENKVTKAWLMDQISEVVDYIMLCRDREIAEKFAAMFKSFVNDPKPDLSEALFTVSMRVWSKIDSPNDNVAWGAAFVQQCCYPPRSTDKIQQAVYEEKHHEAFLKALRHPSLPIRIQAIEGAVEKIVFWWEDFPKVFKSKFIDVVIELAHDSQADVRAAVFKSLRFFVLSPAATTKAIEDILPKICKDGIDDDKEKVRLNCAKAMLFFVEKANTPFDRFIDLNSLCHRLDFEQNEAIELAIFKLIKTASPTEYGLPLQKFVRKFTKISRNAALDYHRLLFTSGQIKIENGLKYTEALVGFIQPFLLKKEEYEEQDNLEGFYEKLGIVKNVFDCAIVLYATIQPHVMATDNSRVRTDSASVLRAFSEIVATIFESFEDHEGLMDSTLTLASLSPTAVKFYPKFFLQVEREVRGGKIDERQIQAFAMNDMNKFTQLLLEGLTQVEMSSQKVASRNVPTPAKQSRPSIFLNELAVIDALTALLDNPTTSAYLLNEYDYFVSQFIAKLVQTRDNFMLARRNGRNSKDMPDALFGRTTDMIAVLRILAFDKKIKAEVKEEDTQKSRRGRRARTAEPELLPAAEQDADPLLYEVDWIQTQFELSPSIVCHSEIAEILYNVLSLYIQSHPHKCETIQKLLDVIEKIKDYTSEHPIRGDRSIISTYNQCKKKALHALDLAKPQEEPSQDGRISTIREEDEEAGSRNESRATEAESYVEEDSKDQQNLTSVTHDTMVKEEPEENCGEFSVMDNSENEPPANDTSSKLEESDLNATLMEEN